MHIGTSMWESNTEREREREREREEREREITTEVKKNLSGHALKLYKYIHVSI